VDDSLDGDVTLFGLSLSIGGNLRMSVRVGLGIDLGVEDVVADLDLRAGDLEVASEVLNVVGRSAVDSAGGATERGGLDSGAVVGLRASCGRSLGSASDAVDAGLGSGRLSGVALVGRKAVEDTSDTGDGLVHDVRNVGDDVDHYEKEEEDVD
jgi:hypothetical protein